MSVFKNLKRGFVGGALIGALIGSQYGSVREAYEKVLDSNVDEKKIIMDYIKQNKKDYADRNAFNKKYEEAREEYMEAKEELKEYKSLSEDEKKSRAFKDIKNYGVTAKNIEFGLPSSKSRWKGAGKGAVPGGISGVVLAGAATARNVSKNRKKKKAKGLESKFFIFLGLLMGGFGLNLISSNITGNFISNLIQFQGILGLCFILVGIVSAYFYFKMR